MPWLAALASAAGGAASAAAGAVGSGLTAAGSALAGGGAAAPGVAMTPAAGGGLMSAAAPTIGSGAMPGLLSQGLTGAGNMLGGASNALSNMMPNFSSWLQEQGTGGDIAQRAFGLNRSGGLLGDSGGFMGSGKGGAFGQQFGTLLQNRLAQRSRGMIPQAPVDMPPNNPGLIGGILGKVGLQHGM